MASSEPPLTARRPSYALAAVAVGLVVATTTACGATTGGGQGDGEFGSGPLLATPAPNPDVAAAERDMFERVNRDRTAQGLRSLEWDDALADAGRRHSRDMADNQFLEHDSPATGSLEDRLVRAGVLFAVARENLALASDVQTAQDSLLESPGHRENLFSPDVRHIGIGVVPGSWQGEEVLFVTQVFARLIEPLAPDAVRRTAADVLRVERHPALDELAQSAAEGDGRPPDADLQATAQALVTAGYPVGALSVVAQTLYENEGVEATAASVRDQALVAGLGAASITDDKGRPAVRLVIVVGEQAP